MTSFRVRSRARRAAAPESGSGLQPKAIVLGYVAAATVWILLSGLLLELAVGDNHALYTTFEQAKGLAFVAVTGLILYLLLRRYTGTLRQANGRVRRLARFAELSPHPIIELGPDGAIVSANA